MYDWLFQFGIVHLLVKCSFHFIIRQCISLLDWLLFFLFFQNSVRSLDEWIPLTGIIINIITKREKLLNRRGASDRTIEEKFLPRYTK